MSSRHRHACGSAKTRAFQNSKRILLFATGLGLCIGMGGYGLCAVFCSNETTAKNEPMDISLINLAFSSDTPDHESTAKLQGKTKTLVLQGPSLSARKLSRLWPVMGDEELMGFLKKYPMFATAKYYLSPVYRHNDKKPYVVGYVRYGHEVRATQSVEAPGCTGGKWHQIVGEGLVCTGEGFEITDKPQESDYRYTKPYIGRIEPFLYAKAKKGSPRFQYIPSADQEKILASGEASRIKELGVVKEWLNGAYFITTDKLVEQDDRSYYRTAMGYYLRKQDVEPLERVQMHGEFLDSKKKLPVAFVFGKDRSLYCLEETDKLRECGVAKKHARMYVSEIREQDKQKFVVGPNRYALIRNQVRLAKRIDRPTGVPEKVKWIHIDLAEQTLVAYENDQPILATLVSSGLDTHATPTGTYQIQRRYLTKTMAGPDPEHGVYEVAEVPWTMYYHGNYAAHGAYWHNVFGEKRSHGCTNIPPADARWLFRWIEPKLPRGWYAMFNQEKSWMHFTN